MAVSGSAAPSAGASAAAHFLPSAVSWLNASDGFVLGEGDCPLPAPGCTSVLRTRDGGRTFTRLPGPPVPLATRDPSTTLAVSQLLFVDPEVGYAYGPGLWMTTDGARHWHLLAPTNVMTVIVGTAVDVLTLACSSGGPACTATGLDVWRAPPGQDTLALAAHLPGPGTGEWSAALSGDRGVITLANAPGTGPSRLWRTDDGGATWIAGTPPCAMDPVATAATGQGELLVACTGSAGAGQQAKTLFASRDDARTFHAVGTAPLEGLLTQVAADGPYAIVLSARGGADVLDASSDGGRTWVTFALADGGVGLSSLAWVTPTTAVVVQGGPGLFGPDRVLISRDRGAHWTPLALLPPPPAGPVGASAVWSAAIRQQAAVASRCLFGHTPGSATSCVLAAMAARGASPDARAFVAAHGAYLIGWRGGVIPVGEELTLAPRDCGCRQLVLLPRAGGVVVPTPHLTGALWVRLESAYPLPGGGTGLTLATLPALVEADPATGPRLLLQYALVNGCATCVISSRARFAVALTPAGRPGPLVSLGPCAIPGVTGPAFAEPRCPAARGWPA